MRMIDFREIPSFQTLSRRARSFDLHPINSDIDMAYSKGSTAAIYSLRWEIERTFSVLEEIVCIVRIYDM
jgi:IS4 transposase